MSIKKFQGQIVLTAGIYGQKYEVINETLQITVSADKRHDCGLASGIKTNI